MINMFVLKDVKINLNNHIAVLIIIVDLMLASRFSYKEKVHSLLCIIKMELMFCCDFF